MLRRPKIPIIGGGGKVRSRCALWAAIKELGNIVAADLPQGEGIVKGRMLDLAQASPIQRFDAVLHGTSHCADIAGSDIVVITAGLPRQPGMSRDDLVQANVPILRSVSQEVKKHAPDAIVIVVSNPLDALVYTAWKVTGFPRTASSARRGPWT